eukprot:m.94614 g.94614  ORF g.94614 m.94614 type:complete len:469 (+) comp13454_c0_seq1:277-1683(+)
MCDTSSHIFQASNDHVRRFMKEAQKNKLRLDSGKPQQVTELIFVGNDTASKDDQSLKRLGIDLVVNSSPTQTCWFESKTRQKAREIFRRAQQLDSGRREEEAKRAYDQAWSLDPVLKVAAQGTQFERESVIHKKQFNPEYVSCPLDQIDDYKLRASMDASYDALDEAMRVGRPCFIHSATDNSCAVLLIHFLINSRTCKSLLDAKNVLENLGMDSSLIHPCCTQFLSKLSDEIQAVKETSQENFVDTNWGHIIERKKTQCSEGADTAAGSQERSHMASHPDFPMLWESNDILSPKECSEIISHSENIGFGRTKFRQEFRGNLRLIVLDRSLGDALWTRIKSCVPEKICLNIEGKNEEWEATGLNECFRIAKYYPGHKFCGHVDACYSRSDTERSMLTVNMYLNHNFTGGHTRFFDHNDLNRVTYSVQPQAGKCCFFQQPPLKYFHDGERVQSGIKYLLRTDVMYTRRS